MLLALSCQRSAVSSKTRNFIAQSGPRETLVTDCIYRMLYALGTDVIIARNWVCFEAFKQPSNDNFDARAIVPRLGREARNMCDWGCASLIVIGRTFYAAGACAIFHRSTGCGLSRFQW